MIAITVVKQDVVHWFEFSTKIRKVDFMSIFYSMNIEDDMTKINSNPEQDRSKMEFKANPNHWISVWRELCFIKIIQKHNIGIVFTKFRKKLTITGASK